MAGDWDPNLYSTQFIEGQMAPPDFWSGRDFTDILRQTRGAATSTAKAATMPPPETGASQKVGTGPQFQFNFPNSREVELPWGGTQRIPSWGPIAGGTTVYPTKGPTTMIPPSQYTPPPPETQAPGGIPETVGFGGGGGWGLPPRPAALMNEPRERTPADFTKIMDEITSNLRQQGIPWESGGFITNAQGSAPVTGYRWNPRGLSRFDRWANSRMVPGVGDATVAAGWEPVSLGQRTGAASGIPVPGLAENISRNYGTLINQAEDFMKAGDTARANYLTNLAHAYAAEVMGASHVKGYEEAYGKAMDVEKLRTLAGIEKEKIGSARYFDPGVMAARQLVEWEKGNPRMMFEGTDEEYAEARRRAYTDYYNMFSKAPGQGGPARSGIPTPQGGVLDLSRGGNLPNPTNEGQRVKAKMPNGNVYEYTVRNGKWVLVSQ